MFEYLPLTLRNCVNLGYAFVSLITISDALHLMQVFPGISKWFVDHGKMV